MSRRKQYLAAAPALALASAIAAPSGVALADDPAPGGQMHDFLDESGVIRFEVDKPATKESPPFGW